LGLGNSAYLELFKNPVDVATVAYDNNDVSDEYTWAGAELSITTKKSVYLSTLCAQVTHL
jgi:hypothetical protein